MRANPNIAAVIPVHNRADLLARLLDTVAAQTSPFAEVLVVDNGSTDGAPALASGRGFRVLPMGSNAGFARAVNAGWRAVNAEWIAILNSDVELDPGWTERLLHAASAAHADFATGAIFDASDRRRIDGSYDLMSRAGCAWRAGHGEIESPGSAAVRIAIAPGTACVFRRRVLERLGGFDESFGSYLEDVDLGLRCLSEGYEGVYAPDAVAWHHGSATFGRWNPRVVRAISRNQLLLVARHYDKALFRQCFRSILVGQLLWGLVALRHGAAPAWAAGKWDALRAFHLEGRPTPRLREFLEASEREIRLRARDPYWRWYFRLAPNAGFKAAPSAAQ